jgi:putative membrane protein
MFHNMENFGWGMGFGWGLMLVFWVLVILSIIAIIRWLSGNSGARTKTALEILQERYARGEIDREEYERIKRDLQS